MRRRLVARVIAMLLAFPLMLRGEDGGCSTHKKAHAPDVQAAATPMEGHRHQHGNPAPTRAPNERAPDEHHLPSDCCPAMSSCSSSAAIAVAEVALASTTWHDVGQLKSADFLHSRVESPDPPPPRA